MKALKVSYILSAMGKAAEVWNMAFLKCNFIAWRFPSNTEQNFQKTGQRKSKSPFTTMLLIYTIWKTSPFCHHQFDHNHLFKSRYDEWGWSWETEKPDLIHLTWYNVTLVQLLNIVFHKVKYAICKRLLSDVWNYHHALLFLYLVSFYNLARCLFTVISQYVGKFWWKHFLPMVGKTHCFCFCIVFCTIKVYQSQQPFHYTHTRQWIKAAIYFCVFAKTCSLLT